MFTLRTWGKNIDVIPCGYTRIYMWYIRRFARLRPLQALLRRVQYTRESRADNHRGGQSEGSDTGAFSVRDF